MTRLESVGDYSVHSHDFIERGLDLLFSAEELSDTAHSTRFRTSAKFCEHFPGWELYRRVVAGVTINDRLLADWAITSARMLAASLKDNGRDWIGPKTRAIPGWIEQAGLDGLDYAVHGRFAEGLHERAARFGVSAKTFQKIRDPVGVSMKVGLATYRAQLHAEYFRVREDERRA